MKEHLALLSLDLSQHRLFLSFAIDFSPHVSFPRFHALAIFQRRS
jgi:hypothetical protein